MGHSSFGSIVLAANHNNDTSSSSIGGGGRKPSSTLALAPTTSSPSSSPSTITTATASAAAAAAAADAAVTATTIVTPNKKIERRASSTELVRMLADTMNLESPPSVGASSTRAQAAATTFFSQQPQPHLESVSPPQLPLPPDTRPPDVYFFLSRAYEARWEKELTVAVGEKVRLCKNDPNHKMWLVEKKSGAKGFVPISHLVTKKGTPAETTIKTGQQPQRRRSRQRRTSSSLPSSSSSSSLPESTSNVDTNSTAADPASSIAHSTAAGVSPDSNSRSISEAQYQQQQLMAMKLAAEKHRLLAQQQRLEYERLALQREHQIMLSNTTKGKKEKKKLRKQRKVRPPTTRL